MPPTVITKSTAFGSIFDVLLEPNFATANTFYNLTDWAEEFLLSIMIPNFNSKNMKIALCSVLDFLTYT